jgi:hypothetical protein
MTSSTDSKLHKWIIVSATIGTVALIVAAVAIRDARNKPNAIVLADDHGRPRVRIAATSDGGLIELLDERGRARIAVRQVGEASSISMHRRDAEDQEATDPKDYALQLLLDETSHLNNITLRDPSTQTVVGLHGSDGGWLSMRGKSGAAMLSGASTIGTGLRLDFGKRNASLDLSDDFANLTLSENGVPMIQLSQSSVQSAVELSAPGGAYEVVSLSAHKYGSSLHLNRSHPTSTAPVQLTAGEEGGRIMVNDQQLSAPTR